MSKLTKQAIDVNTKQVVEVIETGKNPLKSKTLWFNLVVAALALFSPETRAWLSANPEVVMTTFGLINIILRFVTKGKIELLD